MAKYRIQCWIAVEPEEEQIYESIQEARRDLEHFQVLQPENIYKIEEVDDEDSREGGSLERLV